MAVEIIADVQPPQCTEKYNTRPFFRDDIAVLVKPRILIPNVSQCYEEIILNRNNVSVT